MEPANATSAGGRAASTGATLGTGDASTGPTLGTGATLDPHWALEPPALELHWPLETAAAVWFTLKTSSARGLPCHLLSWFAAASEGVPHVPGGSAGSRHSIMTLISVTELAVCMAVQVPCPSGHVKWSSAGTASAAVPMVVTLRAASRLQRKRSPVFSSS